MMEVTTRYSETLTINCQSWQGRQDLNLQPTVLETATLPIELLPFGASDDYEVNLRTNNRKSHDPLPYRVEICYTIMYMAKIVPIQPLLVLLYGFPGAGKTYFARQLCERVQAAHVQGDRIRFELFEKPRYDKQENDVITQLMDYMTEEFLNAGLS